MVNQWYTKILKDQNQESIPGEWQDYCLDKSKSVEHEMFACMTFSRISKGGWGETLPALGSYHFLPVEAEYTW